MHLPMVIKYKLDQTRSPLHTMENKYKLKYTLNRWYKLIAPYMVKKWIQKYNDMESKININSKTELEDLFSW